MRKHQDPIDRTRDLVQEFLGQFHIDSLVITDCGSQLRPRIRVKAVIHRFNRARSSSITSWPGKASTIPSSICAALLSASCTHMRSFRSRSGLSRLSSKLFGQSRSRPGGMDKATSATSSYEVPISTPQHQILGASTDQRDAPVARKIVVNCLDTTLDRCPREGATQAYSCLCRACRGRQAQARP
jgi:hypothetical protein